MAINPVGTWGRDKACLVSTNTGMTVAIWYLFLNFSIFNPLMMEKIFVSIVVVMVGGGGAP